MHCIKCQCALVLRQCIVSGRQGLALLVCLLCRLKSYMSCAELPLMSHCPCIDKLVLVCAILVCYCCAIMGHSLTGVCVLT